MLKTVLGTGKDICLAQYFSFEIILFFPQETSWRVKQYSSTLLLCYQITEFIYVLQAK